MVKVENEMKSSEFLIFMKKELKDFIFHAHVTHVQLKSFKNLTKNPPNATAILVMDFSEKFRPKRQNEVTQAHYSYELVTLLTGAIYFPGIDENETEDENIEEGVSYEANNGNEIEFGESGDEDENEKESESDNEEKNVSENESEKEEESRDENINEKVKPLTFGIVTDSSDQDKYTVFSMLSEMLQYIKIIHPNIEVIEIFTDGAPTQFKNRFSLSTLEILQKNFDLKLKWNFFSTSHGKTVADGVGAILKRKVDRRIATERAEVKNANDFYSVLMETQSEIQVFFVSQEEIDKNKDYLMKLWQMKDEKSDGNLCAVKNTRNFHCFESEKDGYLNCSVTSYDNIKISLKIKK